jgi:hypothetical protein
MSWDDLLADEHTRVRRRLDGLSATRLALTCKSELCSMPSLPVLVALSFHYTIESRGSVMRLMRVLAFVDVLHIPTTRLLLRDSVWTFVWPYTPRLEMFVWWHESAIAIYGNSGPRDLISPTDLFAPATTERFAVVRRLARRMGLQW